MLVRGQVHERMSTQAGMKTRGNASSMQSRHEAAISRYPCNPRIRLHDTVAQGPPHIHASASHALGTMFQSCAAKISVLFPLPTKYRHTYNFSCEDSCLGAIIQNVLSVPHSRCSLRMTPSDMLSTEKMTEESLVFHLAAAMDTVETPEHAGQ